MRAVLLYLCSIVLLSGCFSSLPPTVDVSYPILEGTQPARSQQFPGIYVACDNQATAIFYARRLGVEQLRGTGPRYIRNLHDDCIVTTIAETSYVDHSATTRTRDGFRVTVYAARQGGATFYFLMPSAITDDRSPRWEFGKRTIEPQVDSVELYRRLPEPEHAQLCFDLRGSSLYSRCHIAYREKYCRGRNMRYMPDGCWQQTRYW